MADTPRTTKSKLKSLLQGHDESGAGDTLLREMLGLGEYGQVFNRFLQGALSNDSPMHKYVPYMNRPLYRR